MSTFITKSSSLSGPYIGSCRNRHYIQSRLPSSLFSNNYYYKSFLPIKSEQRFYLLNRVTTDTLQKRIPIDYVSSPSLLDEQKLHQEQKAKGFSSSSSSSSLLHLPTTQNITPITCYDRSPSFVKEQQKFHHQHHLNNQQHSSVQPNTSENQNNQSLYSGNIEYQQNQPIIHNIPIVSKHPLKDNNSFSSSRLLPDSIVSNNDKNNQSNLFTSINIHNQSSNLNLSIDFQNKSNVNQLNTMSSLRYSSGLGTNSSTTIHSYDERINDQGNKYIIQLKTDDYQENEFKITLNSYLNQLIIDAKHNEEDNYGGYIRRELHKIFHIPKHVDLYKYTYSYNKNTQELTIEMPYLQTIINENTNNNTNSSSISPIQNPIEPLTFSYDNLNLTNEKNILSKKQTQFDHDNINKNNNNNNTTPISSIKNSKPFNFDLFHQSVFNPQIIEKPSNEKKLLMSLDLNDYQPEDIKVSIKDQELIVKAERKIETNTRKSRTSFFQSTSLPPQTDIEHLQSNYINGKLIIEAPYMDRKILTNNNQDINEQTVTEIQQKTIDDDPFQHRTETVTEYIRRRRL